MERIVVKSTDECDCFYCHMCIDDIKCLDNKLQKLQLKYNITQSTIQNQIDEMNRLYIN